MTFGALVKLKLYEMHHRALNDCKLMVSGSISLCSLQYFSPFPHGTCSLSVDYEYLALEDGPPMFRQDFTCPALLYSCLVPQSTFFIRGYHPLWPDFPFRSDMPTAKTRGLLRFRSPLLSESRLMSFPRATEMFQFKIGRASCRERVFRAV